MIEVRDLVKSYTKDERRALDELSLSVRPGELYGFLGPNGAGKTTTIKILVGLLRPDSGSASVAGVDVLADPLEVKRRIGYVPDEPLLYENMTGQRFLSFIADAFEVPGAERSRILELAEEFELRDALGDRISSYSHGMKQKVAIIGALLHDPDVFILDEPIVGLDPQSSYLLKETMRRHCERGKTVFFSTHVMEVAERLCDRVGIIRHGQLVAEGPLDELRARAGSTDATLESIFLELTHADDIASTRQD
ncbi:MAG: ABC transporter ATP-binding protein [Spirochaetota bacterium]